ncbi:MAG: tRNA (guanosine(18)-2'-O)-methyltransferase TrmH [Acidobacteria bacterium]|nr:tRNA (guanosine(18)-2'-O)-methyltransferase TrmH [Acidobacteriota bacterium]
MTPERYRRLCEVLDRRQPDLTVVMEQVHKPHNLSAVMRTSDAVGVLEVHAVDPSRPVRASGGVAQGTQRWVDVQRYETIRDAAEVLHHRGFTIAAAHPDADAVPFRDYDYTQPTALLLGQEKEGVTAEALELCDAKIVIPMEGFVASLNVSVAAALILFEAQRQRAKAGMYERTRLAEPQRTRLLFEWAFPRIAALCRQHNVPYPRVSEDGEILDELPFTAGGS